MADQQHLDILKQGVDAWNAWRKVYPEIHPDLRDADLRDTHLTKANFHGTDFSEANLLRANADLSDLTEAHLQWTNLSYANLTGAHLMNAELEGTHLHWTNLSRADLRGAHIGGAVLVGTNLQEANLTNSSIHGISAWNVHLEKTIQTNLIITPHDEPIITVDNLEVAQFIYLLLNNEEIRNVIDTITSKVILILGRFTRERKRNYLPVVFDFEKPVNRDLTETISTLAHMARFIIADITDPRSIPQELAFIVPNLPSVPVQPLLQTRAKEYGMSEHFRSFPWVLEAYRYATVDRLLASLKEHVIEPAEQKAKELAIEKAERLERP